MPITMTPVAPLSPAAQMQAQALAQAMAGQGIGLGPQLGPTPGLNSFAAALGQQLRKYVGQQQQNNLNAQTMVSPVEGP